METEDIMMKKFMEEYHFKNIICNNGEWIAIDENNNKWKYNKDSNIFVQINKSNPFSVDNQVLEKLRMEFEDRWMDLNISIDNCQGCMDGLDEAFDELKLLKQIVAFLCGDIDRDYELILNKAYNRYKEAEKKKQEETAKKDEIIKPLEVDFRKIVVMEDPYKDIIFDLIWKVQEIIGKMRDKA